MFASRKSDKKEPGSRTSSQGKGTSERELAATTQKELQTKLLKAASKNKQQQQQLQSYDGYDERQSFIIKNQGKKAKLAKQETLDEQAAATSRGCGCCRCCSSAGMMLLKALKCKWVLIPLFIICCIAAIYCIPFIEIEARIPVALPHIPFNYHEGPLRASTASQFKIERLFAGQVSGPESVALDSQGNMYMAIEGGFILYAHLNKSSLPKRTYYVNDPPNTLRSQQPFDVLSPDYTELVKIAELNGIRQLPYGAGPQRRSVASPERVETRGSWRRECPLDEQVYGQQLYTGGVSESPQVANNEIDSIALAMQDERGAKKFASNVVISRCSKPLGVRLSPDESYLYVVDTLSGLYRVNLKLPERQFSTQRSVNKLIDFRGNNRHQLLPVISSDDTTSQQQQQQQQWPQFSRRSQQEYLNVSLMAVDDLVIDYGAGSKGGDMIYMSDASQNWHATSFVFDMLEGRPSGAILQYDTGINQLSVLSQSRVAHVRTSGFDFDNSIKSRLADTAATAATAATTTTTTTTTNLSEEDTYLGLGAPRLDENDVFDDRPLSFVNGLELTDDKQAILIADTTNKRIIKHYIKGSRRGTSDLWAWTPNFPDNIRRGYDKNHETYWVVGCGEDTTNKPDLLAWLHSWPRVRKYLLKNIYLVGWFFEVLGGKILQSNGVRDFGYSLKSGNSLCESLCSGMMILQYNKYGDVIRSIYSKEFPNDISLYSQVNEIIDAKLQEHVLYLSSPTYKYVTKLVLPSDSFDLPPASPQQ